MDKIGDVKLVPLSKSKYIQPYRVLYTQVWRRTRVILTITSIS